jgi:hypothetical protein
MLTLVAPSQSTKEAAAPAVAATVPMLMHRLVQTRVQEQEVVAQAMLVVRVS